MSKFLNYLLFKQRNANLVSLLVLIKDTHKPQFPMVINGELVTRSDLMIHAPVATESTYE